MPKLKVPASWVTVEYTDVRNYLNGIRLIDADDGVAYDTETNGLTVFGNPEFRMVGIGFAHGNTGIYLDTSAMTYDEIKTILQLLRDTLVKLNIRLIAHNLFYDMSVTRFYLGRGNDLPFIADTYGLYRYLASEGFFNQRWGLKQVMTDMLLWADTNETERDDYLIAHGFVNNQGKPLKGEMYRCPGSILGPYCILDSYATYQFYREILLPAINTYCTPLFTWFHREAFINTLVTECVTNYEEGIFIDRDILLNYDKALIVTLKRTRKGIYKQHRECIDEINASLLKAHMDKCPETRYKLVKKTDGKCPEKRNRSGALSKNYLRYALRQRKYEREILIGGPIAKNYAAFRKFRRDLKYWQKHTPVFDAGVTPEQFKSYIFNLNSTAHKMLLLYKGVEIQILREFESADRRGSFVLPNGIELDYSKSGAKPTGKSAIMSIFGMSSAISIYNMELKKQQFTRAVLDKLTDASRIHLPVKVPGTYSTRISGDGGINLQNLVKSPEFLSAWRVEDPHTHVIAEIDFSSIEPHILTELSRCPAMLKVYGPDAKPNDIYIFTAAMVGGVLGQPFLDMGYDPVNPTAEIIHACKKKHKGLRNVAKTIALSDDYGASAKKKWQTLRIQGYDFTLAQVKDIQERLDRAFAGKKAFGKRLQAEHARNNGYILDGLGFPTPIAPDKIKDCTNRCIQKSAHEILMLFLYKVITLFKERNIWYSFSIADFHDETLPIIKLTDVAKVKLIYKEAVEWLNVEMLHGTIKLKAEPQFAVSLAEIKVEGYHDDDQELADLMDVLNNGDE